MISLFSLLATNCARAKTYFHTIFLLIFVFLSYNYLFITYCTIAPEFDKLSIELRTNEIDTKPISTIMLYFQHEQVISLPALLLTKTKHA